MPARRPHSPGATTADVASRLEGLLERCEPDAVAAMTGINDKYDTIAFRPALSGRGARMIAMQYPMREIVSLEKSLAGVYGVELLSNEEPFRTLVSSRGCGEYFSDRFAGDFGRCTREGNALIAENAAGMFLGPAP